MYDYVIIGAGVVGAFTALQLSRLGRKVALVERKAPGQEASGLNAGSLSVQNKPLPLVRLSLLGVETWERFEAETGRSTGYHRTGGLRVAHDEEGLARLRLAAATHRQMGLEIEEVTGDEARYRCPALGPAVVGANYSHFDGHNDALTATITVVREAVSKGAVLLSGRAATGISRNGGGYTVETDRGPVHGSRVVVCAGLWTRDVAARLGFEIPLTVRNNQMMVTERVAPLLPLMVTHISGRLTLKQVHAGSVLIGGGWPGGGDVAGNRKWPGLSSMIGNAALAVKVVPALASLQVIRSWAGFDGRTGDELPLVGEVPGVSGVWICTSCWGTYTLGPALAGQLALWMETGVQPELLAGFGPGQREIGDRPQFLPA